MKEEGLECLGRAGVSYNEQYIIDSVSNIILIIHSVSDYIKQVESMHVPKDFNPSVPSQSIYHYLSNPACNN